MFAIKKTSVSFIMSTISIAFIPLISVASDSVDDIGVFKRNGYVLLPFNYLGDQGQETSVNLDDALNNGMKISNKYLSANEKLKADEYQKNASYGKILPAIDVRAGTGFQNASETFDTTTGNPLGTARRNEIYAVMSQPLFDIGAISDIRKAKAKESGSYYQLLTTEDDVTYEITSAYYNLLQSVFLVDLNKEKLDRLEKLGDVIKIRSDIGGAAKNDSERVKARILTSRSNLQDSIEVFRQSVVKFYQLTGYKPIQLNYSKNDLNISVPSKNNIIKSMYEKNPEIISAEKNEEYAHQDTIKNKASFLPRVKLELSTNNYTQGGNTAKHDNRVMVVMEMSIFSGFSDYNKTYSSIAAENQAKYERLDLEKQYTSNLEIAFGAISSAVNKIKILESQIKTQRDVVLSLEKQQSINGGKILDLFDSYQEYYNSQQELVRTQIQQILLQKQVIRIAGNIRASQ